MKTKIIKDTIMKNNIIHTIKKHLILFAAAMLFIPACTLDEDVYSIYTADTYYENDAQVMSTLSGIYRNFAGLCSMGTPYRIMELCTDEEVVLGRVNGWWQNSTFYELLTHTWTEQNSYIDGGWDSFFKIVGQTNALISSLEKTTNLDVDQEIAELRALRAYAYFFLMDLYGNVPIFTDEKVEATNLPTQNTRSEVFDFIVSEIEVAIDELPSQNDVGSDYYGRFTKEALYALMATIYLNGEVYTGTDYYAEAITYADLVINSGAYSLLDDYFDNFVYDNDENAEMIFTAVFDPNATGGIGHPFVCKTLPAITGVFGLPYQPQSGFGTTEELYALFDDDDDRKDMILPYGPMVNPETGDTVMVESVVTDGPSVLYVEGESTSGPVPFELTEMTGYHNQSMAAGMRWIKWGVDPNTNGNNAGNDVAFLRYADVLLIKAEASFREGNTSVALNLVNQVRERSHASTLTELTLQDLLDERGRELAFEMTRRRDLIRFGKFTEAWGFKDASDDYRCLYPIPKDAMDANSNLVQNTGY